MLDVSVEYSNQIDNAGYLAVFISAKRSVEEFDEIEEGRLNVEFELKDRNSSVQFPVRVNVAKTPPKRFVTNQNVHVLCSANEYSGTPFAISIIR